MSTAVTVPQPGEAVDVGAALSVFDPFIDIGEVGHLVDVPMILRSLLVGGEPGAGKSSLLNLIAAHAALSAGQETV